jgi:hypothetical protein
MNVPANDNRAQRQYPISWVIGLCVPFWALLWWLS